MAGTNLPDEEKVGDEKTEACAGLLKKKGKRSNRWSQVFAKIESNQFKYGNSEQDLIKSLPLAGAMIEDGEEHGCNNSFSIRPTQCKRTFYFLANTTEEHSKWLQAICLAKFSNAPKVDKSEACTIQ